MASIYNIKQAYLELMRDAEQQEGVLTDEQIEAFKITEEQFAEKSESYAQIIRTLEADCAFCDAEVERINKIKITKSNLIDRLEKIVLDAIMLFGTKDSKKDIWRYEIGTFKLSSRKSPSRIEIDEAFIDGKWKVITIKDKLSLEDLVKVSDALGKNLETLTTIPKTPIKEAIEAGEIVKGAQIVEGGYILSLK